LDFLPALREHAARRALRRHGIRHGDAGTERLWFIMRNELAALAKMGIPPHVIVGVRFFVGLLTQADFFV
jgi:hypothetical protein